MAEPVTGVAATLTSGREGRAVGSLEDKLGKLVDL